MYAACRSSPPRAPRRRRGTARMPRDHHSGRRERKRRLASRPSCGASVPTLDALGDLLQPTQLVESRAAHDEAAREREPRLERPGHEPHPGPRARVHLRSGTAPLSALDRERALAGAELERIVRVGEAQQRASLRHVAQRVAHARGLRGGGTRSRSRPTRFAIASRSGVFAATPPPSRTLRAPYSAAARAVFSARTSATAFWNEAATSGTEKPGCSRV